MVSELLRGDNGFTYDAKVTEDSGIVEVRDARDEYFARAEYVPEVEKYFIEIDAGYTTKEDLEAAGLMENLTLVESEVSKVDNPMIRGDEDSREFREMTTGVAEGEDLRLEVEEIESEDRKNIDSINN